MRTVLSLLAAVVLLGGCDSDGTSDDDVTALFTITNETAADGGNDVLSFTVTDDGAVVPAGRFPTGAAGSGIRTDVGRDPLSSQDAVLLSPDDRFLFVVNAGSGSVSSFRRDGASLDLAGTVSSGGTAPVALAVAPDGETLYVLNEGASPVPLPGIPDDGSTGSVRAFDIGDDGELMVLDGSDRPLSGVTDARGTIDVSPDGRLLVATEFIESRLVTYVIGDDGRLGTPHVQDVDGNPFGGEFSASGAFHTANLELTDDGPAPEGATTTSYRFAADGTASVIGTVQPTGGTAACWAEVSADQTRLLTVNTDNRTVSVFDIAADGSVSPVAGGPVMAVTGDQSVALGEGADPLEAATVGDRVFLLVPTPGRIQTWQLQPSGEMVQLADSPAGLPEPASGLAVTGQPNQ